MVVLVCFRSGSTLVHAADHAAAQAAAIAYADVKLKRPFCPSSHSRSRAGSHCHRYFFVRLTICLSVRPSVRLHPTDSLSVRQTVSPFAVRQSVSPSVCQSVRPFVRQPSGRPSTVSQSINRPSIRQPPSVCQPPSVRQPFLLGGKKGKIYITQEI